QAFDPVNRPGNWHANPNFLVVFTQAPAKSPPNGLTGGGMDDRFDFEMITAGLLDGTGLEYLAGSYHPFGNNGTMPFEGNINDPSNPALPDLPNRIDVLNLMTTVTDHIPVVADYVFVSGDGPFSSGQAFWGARGFDRNTVAALARMVGGLPTPVNPPGDGQPLPVQSLPVISHDGAMA